MIRLNLFDNNNDLEHLRSLHSSLKNKSIIDVKHIDTIKVELSSILNYNERGEDKPIDFIENWYNIFEEMYRYEGVIYRGIVGEFMEDRNNELLSFSSNLDVANRFAEGDDIKTTLIKQDTKYGFNFAELMTDICEINKEFYDICEQYLGEDEVFDILRDFKEL